ncbi:MAG: hypothetical protein ETSY1_19555 [Candidatus Entotheonella factor]|uniref:Cation/H+ exchanger transmembrane domain-containing protein n=1 Tax=Entotheonella factor TaxID=1429438 RepID=W4LJH8_ENTF1|nr:cation:proton antiporter [Candidatus Entotheonella palauensis]ETW98258.1 MAG: hypothetical protein ETSY1_19555 [Candidatus Entotheonella factor]
MMENALDVSVFLVGLVAVLTTLVKSLCNAVGIPSVVGFLLLGFAIRLGDLYVVTLPRGAEEIIAFLAEIGIICFLFRIGLESNLNGLTAQLKRAGVIWVGNVVTSGLCGYLTCVYLLDLPLLPSLFVAVAFTATSVGIPVAVWQDASAMRSDSGDLLLDVAEMDDISAVVLMAILFAMAPIWHTNHAGVSVSLIGLTVIGVLLKLGLFSSICALFSACLERPLTRFFKTLKAPSDPLILVIGVAFIIAACAGLLGFSVALGAFFVGLVFSRDPDVVKMDVSFDSLFALFTPFFFVQVGTAIDPSALWTAGLWGGVLLGAAMASKFLGTAVPARCVLPNWKIATVLGISMMPRAEIALVVMQKGLEFGAWAVSDEVFSAMVLVSAGTCLIVPLVLRVLLRQWHTIL